MANTEDNLEKLSEFLENDLAKKLLQSFRNGAGGSSIKAILEQELVSKESLKVEDDKAKDN